MFDGAIYEFYEEKDEMEVLPVNHLQFVSYDEEARPCMIDVVRKTYFSEFLQIIENDFEIYNEVLSNRSG